MALLLGLLINSTPAANSTRMRESISFARKVFRRGKIAPSLTAAAHIAIATGSIAAANDVVSNTFHLVASPFTFNISGFSAPIGGYLIDGPAQSPELTAVPLWRPLLENSKTVATATWPGGDGLNVTVPGRDPSIIVQPAAERTVTYTVPFGAATTPFQKGFP